MCGMMIDGPCVMMGAVVFSWGVDLVAREFTAVVGFGLRIKKHRICQDSFCFSQVYVL